MKMMSKSNLESCFEERLEKFGELQVVLRRLKEELAEAGVMSDLEVKWTELRWC